MRDRHGLCQKHYDNLKAWGLEVDLKRLADYYKLPVPIVVEGGRFGKLKWE